MAHINFYFHCETIVAPYRSTRTYTFWSQFQDQCPYDVSINTFTSYTELEQLSDDTVNIVVIPLNKPYFMHMQEVESNWLQSAYRANDRSRKNVLVLDYSNETELPGTFGPKEVWHHDVDIQFERFYLTTLALEMFNHNILMPVAGVFPDWNFVATIIGDRYHNSGGLRDSEKSAVACYEGKTATKKFIFPNRVARKHRLDFLFDMHNRQMLLESYWSLIYPNSNDAGVQRDYSTEHDYFKVFGNEPKYMDQPLLDWSKGGTRITSTSELLPFQYEQYLAYVCVDTYADTVSRARVDLPGHNPRIIDISEKVAKGFAQGVPCFYYGTFGSLTWLKNNGFWFPGDFKDLPDDVARRTSVLDNMASFENVISKTTADGIAHNRNIILNRKFLYSKCSALIDHIYTKFCS